MRPKVHPGTNSMSLLQRALCFFDNTPHPRATSINTVWPDVPSVCLSPVTRRGGCHQKYACGNPIAAPWVAVLGGLGGTWFNNGKDLLWGKEMRKKLKLLFVSSFVINAADACSFFHLPHFVLALRLANFVSFSAHLAPRPKYLNLGFLLRAPGPPSNSIPFLVS